MFGLEPTQPCRGSCHHQRQRRPSYAGTGRRSFQRLWRPVVWQETYSQGGKRDQQRCDRICRGEEDWQPRPPSAYV